MAKTKSIKGKAIADANMILDDPDKLATLEKWFFNKEVSGTFADLFRDVFWDGPGPLDPPSSIADAIERFQFPFNPCPELSGKDWQDYWNRRDNTVPRPESGIDDSRRYFGHFMDTLVFGLCHLRQEPEHASVVPFQQSA
jgi:hypothetical protein